MATAPFGRLLLWGGHWARPLPCPLRGASLWHGAEMGAWCWERSPTATLARMCGQYGQLLSNTLLTHAPFTWVMDVEAGSSSPWGAIRISDLCKSL